MTARAFMYLNRFKRHMQIAFGKLLEFWFIFSRSRSVFACWRSFYPFLNEEVFLFHCKCCIKTGFSRCSSQEFAVFTVLICLVTTLNMLTFLSHLSHVTRKGKSLNSSHYVWLLSSKDHTGHQERSYMWEITFTFVYTCFFSDIFKIVWPQVCFSLLSTCKVSQKCRDGRKYRRSAHHKALLWNKKLNLIYNIIYWMIQKR